MRVQNSLQTLQKDDGTYTTDTASTVQYMMDNFVPDDSNQDDREQHQILRTQVTEPLNTPDDVEFTQAEILAVLNGFDPKKAPGEDGFTSEILLRGFRLFPLFFTALYNACLNKGNFPKIWKRSVIIPILKPGKEGSQNVSKYRPISLLSVGGKVLEKLLIDRTLHHVLSGNLLNTRQFGFLPGKSTVDAAMAMKNFVQENLQQYGYIVLTSLDVKGAFDAAWWPSILNNLRQLQCPKNLYKLSQNYFQDRTASLCTNAYTVEKEVKKGCPQGSCCGPGFWNILYNSLLSLEFTQ